MEKSAGDAPEDNSYLSFYSRHGIIPVRQDLSKMDLHRRRRRLLYEPLGLPTIAFRGAKIIEFGPGTGDNALVLAEWGPGELVLVDGNPSSINAIRDKVAAGQFSPEVRVVEINIADYQTESKFDIVLCEGVVPAQPETRGFLRHISSFAGQDGIVVITTMSAMGCLAEICRRLMKAVYASRSHDFQEQLLLLTKFFELDLKTLVGMSRRPDDWVLDNILHPWPENVIFTVPDALEALENEFDVLGTSSPQYMYDLRWYKAAALDSRGRLDIARRLYYQSPELLLDSRVEAPAAQGDGELGERLERLCYELFLLQQNIWRHDATDLIPSFLDKLNGLAAEVDARAPDAASAMRDFCVGMRGMLAGSEMGDFGRFRSWFGRGQQYISFVRRQ